MVVEVDGLLCKVEAVVIRDTKAILVPEASGHCNIRALSQLLDKLSSSDYEEGVSPAEVMRHTDIIV